MIDIKTSHCVLLVMRNYGIWKEKKNPRGKITYSKQDSDKTLTAKVLFRSNSRKNLIACRS